MYEVMVRISYREHTESLFTLAHAAGAYDAFPLAKLDLLVSNSKAWQCNTLAFISTLNNTRVNVP
jgi:hypothetical protein